MSPIFGTFGSSRRRIGPCIIGVDMAWGALRPLLRNKTPLDGAAEFVNRHFDAPTVFASPGYDRFRTMLRLRRGGDAAAQEYRRLNPDASMRECFFAVWLGRSID